MLFQFISMGNYLCSGLAGQVPIIKPAHRHKTQKQYIYTKTLNKQNKNNMVRKSNIKEVLWQKP
jgi:hypothetical protein